MKQVNLVEFSGILRFAQERGYDWNEACEFLDDLRPQYEVNHIDFNINDIDDVDYGYCDKLKSVMRDYFAEKKVHSISIV